MADTPTTVTQQQVGFAPDVAPYAQDVLGQAQALSALPYQAYTGDQVAGFSPLQQQSYDYAGQLTSSPQLQDATALAGQAGLGALNTQYTYQPSDFTSDQAQKYMSPYMQNVVDVQQQQAKRQAAIQNQAMQAQAANAGAFGGGRQGIMQAQANAELQRNLQGIQATGLQNAFQNAQQQYNTQQQQNAQQQQFGASLGMQGLGLANTAANTLGSLGQTQYAQNVGLVGLQNQLGLQQQQQAQNVLNTNYQNYLNQQNYPYKQLGFYSDIVRGAPLTTTGSAVYQSAPSAIQNLSSLGLGAYGLSSLFGGSTSSTAGNKAAGGLTKSYATGGSVLSDSFKEYAVGHIDPRLLPQAQRDAQARGDIQTAQYSQEQMAEDAALRKGIAGALPPNANVVRAAGGGIVAFAAGGDAKNQLQKYAEQSMADIYTAPTPEQYTAGVQQSKQGLSQLYGASQVDPLIQQDIARRQAALDTMGSRANAMTALRMAAALQKQGVTSNQRWGDMMATAADSAEKADAAKATAENELFKAKIAGAAATQARADGFTDKAIAAQQKQQDYAIEAAKAKSTAASHMAQVYGGIEQAQINAAPHWAAAQKETFDMGSVNAKIRAAIAKDSSLANDPDRLAVVRDQAFQQTAREIKPAYGAEMRADTAAQDKATQAVDLRLMMKGPQKEQYKKLQADDQAAGTNTADAYRAQLIRNEMNISTPSGGAPQSGSPQPGNPQLTIPPAAVSKLKDAPTAANKAYFDAIFGQGAADRALKGQ